MWIYFLKAKSETSNAVMQFIASAEKQTNCQVKIIQTDGGKEFLSLKEFFQKKELVTEQLVPIPLNRMA